MNDSRFPIAAWLFVFFIALGLLTGHLFATSVRASGSTVLENLGISLFGIKPQDDSTNWTVIHSESAPPVTDLEAIEEQLTVEAQTQSGPLEAEEFIPDDQKNYLLIGVKQNQAGQNILEGVWLAIQVPSSPRILFMPIYPIVSPHADTNADEIADLKSLYGERKELAPPEEFMVALEDMGIWWSYFIVLDQSVFVELNTLAGAPAGNDPAWNQPGKLTDLDEQYALALEICHNLDHLLAQREHFAEYLLKMHGRYASNLEPTRLVDTFVSLFRYGDNLACEFPSRSLSALR